jgi:hypothetical protein
LYVAQSTSTFATSSTSYKNNSAMHCYIDGDAFESKMGTKFETPYSNVSNAYIPNIWNDLEIFLNQFWPFQFGYLNFQ